MTIMEPRDYNEEDFDFELDGEVDAEDWEGLDEETLELDWEESDALSVARELGITSGL